LRVGKREIAKLASLESDGVHEMKEDRGTGVEFSSRDVAEIAVGTCAIAFPVAVTQEVWDLGVELSMIRAALIGLVSVAGLALVVLLLHHPKKMAVERKVFLQRLLSTYGIALLISSLLLLAINRFDLLGAPLIGLKRAILVTFPACFAATGVDSIASAGSSGVRRS